MVVDSMFELFKDQIRCKNIWRHCVSARNDKIGRDTLLDINNPKDYCNRPLDVCSEKFYSNEEDKDALLEEIWGQDGAGIF